jgi:hypothetical protein
MIRAVNFLALPVPVPAVVITASMSARVNLFPLMLVPRGYRVKALPVIFPFPRFLHGLVEFPEQVGQGAAVHLKQVERVGPGPFPFPGIRGFPLPCLFMGGNINPLRFPAYVFQLVYIYVMVKPAVINAPNIDHRKTVRFEHSVKFFGYGGHNANVRFVKKFGHTNFLRACFVSRA